MQSLRASSRLFLEMRLPEHCLTNPRGRRVILEEEWGEKEQEVSRMLVRSLMYSNFMGLQAAVAGWKLKDNSDGPAPKVACHLGRLGRHLVGRLEPVRRRLSSDDLAESP